MFSFFFLLGTYVDKEQLEEITGHDANYLTSTNH